MMHINIVSVCWGNYCRRRLYEQAKLLGILVNLELYELTYYLACSHIYKSHPSSLMVNLFRSCKSNSQVVFFTWDPMHVLINRARIVTEPIGNLLRRWSNFGLSLMPITPTRMNMAIKWIRFSCWIKSCLNSTVEVWLVCSYIKTSPFHEVISIQSIYDNTQLHRILKKTMAKLATFSIFAVAVIVAMMAVSHIFKILYLQRYWQTPSLSVVLKNPLKYLASHVNEIPQRVRDSESHSTIHWNQNLNT